MARRKRRKPKKNLMKTLGKALIGMGSFAMKVVPLVICLSVGAGVFFGVRTALYADSNLLIQKITVLPNDALSQAVRRRIESNYLGKNIFKADLEGIARKLEKDPTIRRADVKRSFPSEIKIEVEQRVPLGWVQFARGGYYGLVSKDGVILDVSKEMDRNMIVIESFFLKNSNLRGGYPIMDLGFQEGVRFLKLFWKHEISKSERITRMKIEKSGNSAIILGGGPTIRLGRYATECIHKISKIIPILQSRERKNIDYIDLQYDDVIVKRKGN